MASQDIPTTGDRTELASSIKSFLDQFSDLHLGGLDHYTAERAHHLKVFGIQSIPSEKIHPIGHVEDVCIPGPHRKIPVRVLYPESGPSSRSSSSGAGAGALIYFHGGGYTVGSVDEFENGLRLLAATAGVQVYAVEYLLAPEHKYPVQLDEYEAVIDALQSKFGSERGVAKVFGGGDSAGGNMTAAVSLRRHDEGKKNLDGQFLFYPEARLPFDTPAAVENNSGYYLECNGIFSFADHYLPRGVPPSARYISPGMQDAERLKGLPPAAVYTSGYDPLRDVGVEYAHKLNKAGNQVTWKHYPALTHGWLQMTAWSEDAVAAVKDAAAVLKKLAYD